MFLYFGDFFFFFFLRIFILDGLKGIAIWLLMQLQSFPLTPKNDFVSTKTIYQELSPLHL